MVEQVVAELSSFRKAASQANEYVSQLFGGLLPSASKTNEASKELSATAKASSRNDDRIRTESNKAAAAASETADLGKQILNELKDFSKNFTSLIGGGDGSLIGNILGFGVGGASLAMNASFNPEEGFSGDMSYDPNATAPYASEGGGNVSQAQSNVRNMPIDENLLNILSIAAKEAGVNVNVVSGGQMSLQEYEAAPGSKYNSGGESPTYYLNGKAVRRGSTRHDNGAAADLDLIDPSTGQKIEYNERTQNVFHNFITLSRQYGATGIGFGFGREDGYMGGDRIHVGFGASAFWGEVSEDENNISAQIMGVESGSKSLPEPINPSAPPPPNIEIEEPKLVRGEETPSPATKENEIIQASFSNPITPVVTENSLAMAGTEIEAVNFEPERTTKTSQAVDLSSPATNYRTASLSGTNTSRQVVTPAVNYQAPKETTVASSGLPATRTPKQLNIKFDTNWISEANGKKQKTKETWMA
jgi:hypothetical protein